MNSQPIPGVGSRQGRAQSFDSELLQSTSKQRAGVVNESGACRAASGRDADGRGQRAGELVRPTHSVACVCGNAAARSRQIACDHEVSLTFKSLQAGRVQPAAGLPSSCMPLSTVELMEAGSPAELVAQGWWWPSRRLPPDHHTPMSARGWIYGRSLKRGRGAVDTSSERS